MWSLVVIKRLLFPQSYIDIAEHGPCCSVHRRDVTFYQSTPAFLATRHLGDEEFEKWSTAPNHHEGVEGNSQAPEQRHWEAEEESEEVVAADFGAGVEEVDAFPQAVHGVNLFWLGEDIF